MSKLNKFLKQPKLFFRDMVAKQMRIKPAPPNAPEAVPTAVAKNYQSYARELVNFIDSYPVNSIVYRGERIWPFFRAQFYVQLSLLGSGRMSYAAVRPYDLYSGNKVNLPIYVRESYKEKHGVLEISDVEKPSAPLDFLFITMTNAAEQEELDGKIYLRFTDPIYEMAKTVGSAMKLEVIKAQTDGIKKTNRYYHPALLLVPPVVVSSGYHDELSLESNKFVSIANKLMPSLKFNPNDFKDVFDWQQHTRSYYFDLLEKLLPKVIFIHAFHYQSPLISAAHQLGIKVIDIQHGLQVGWNPLYNNWDEMPDEGYASLPDHFFVWGEKEFQNCNKVFRGKKHSPILSGYPWLNKQLELNKKLSTKLLDKINSYQIRVIVLLQNQKAIPDLYKNIIEAKNDKIVWIIRHHPKGVKFSSADFASNRENIVFSEEIDKSYISCLFFEVDVSLSDGSATSVEGDYFGVHTIIASNDGRVNYKAEIDQGLFHFIESAEEFYEVIESIDISSKESKINAFSNVDLQDVLSKLIA